MAEIYKMAWIYKIAGAYKIAGIYKMAGAYKMAVVPGPIKVAAFWRIVIGNSIVITLNNASHT